MQKNETPSLGEVMIASVRFREYLKAIALPSIVIVFLNAKGIQAEPEQMNVFIGDLRFAVGTLVLLSVPSILFAVWKHPRIGSSAVVGGLLGVVGGFALSVIRFVELVKFHVFFNIIIEALTVGVAGVLVGMLVWLFAQALKKIIPRMKGGVKQWRTQKHARA